MFVINLKDRTDKLDSIQLSASLTGFNLDVIEGVRGTEISNKSMPPNGVPDVSTDKALPPASRQEADSPGRKSTGTKKGSTV